MLLNQKVERNKGDGKMFFESDNHVTLQGNLATLINPNYTNSGKAVANFNLYVPIPASNKNGTQKSAPIPCKIWDKNAENLAKYTAKGSPIAVTGFLTQESFEDRKGEIQYKTVVIVSSFKLIEGKEKTEERRKK